MDMQAMSAGTMPRDPSRIQQTVVGALAKAHEFQSQNDLLAAFREYQSLVRDFRGLTDVSSAETSPAELAKNKAVKTAEKEEASALEQQARMTARLSAQMQALATSDRYKIDVADLRGSLADLRKRAADSRNSNQLKALVLRRALGQLVVEAMESGQRQHILEILQMRHERVQVAFERCFFTLGQSEQIVPAGPWRGFPIFRPGRRRRAI